MCRVHWPTLTVDQQYGSSWSYICGGSFLVVRGNVHVVQAESVRLRVGHVNVLRRSCDGGLGVSPGAAVWTRKIGWVNGRHIEKTL